MTTNRLQGAPLGPAASCLSSSRSSWSQLEAPHWPDPGYLGNDRKCKKYNCQVKNTMWLNIVSLAHTNNKITQMLTFNNSGWLQLPLVAKCGPNITAFKHHSQWCSSWGQCFEYDVFECLVSFYSGLCPDSWIHFVSLFSPPNVYLYMSITFFKLIYIYYLIFLFSGEISFHPV